MPSDSTCIFCKIINKEIPADILYEDAHYLCFLDIHPISPGHALVIPKNHSRDILDAAPKDREGLLAVVAKVAPAILKGVHATAFNIGINTGKPAGQVVFHTHIHIIPRQDEDGLKSWDAHKIGIKELQLIRAGISPHL
ncbi:MAG: HIT family protein [Candidatus Iainarchaeum archaeon]|uniref:HIT family protein n=1 Tax=Candidatus Iainarchaeum sp. TaxID=3101447 RepID=A0A7T9DIX3_9ARCH|nr:MAG: HIT family protein [Candidatus Diapherotrites archaeon]